VSSSPSEPRVGQVARPRLVMDKLKIFSLSGPGLMAAASRDPCPLATTCIGGEFVESPEPIVEVSSASQQSLP